MKNYGVSDVLRCAMMMKPKAPGGDEEETSPARDAGGSKLDVREVSVKDLKRAPEYTQIYGAEPMPNAYMEALASPLLSFGPRPRVIAVEGSSGKLLAVGNVEHLKAARHAGEQAVEVEVVGAGLSSAELTMLVVRHNQHPTQSRLSQCLLAYYLKKAQQTLAKERKRNGWRKRGKAGSKGELPPDVGGSSGDVRDIIAGFLDLSHGTIDKMVKLAQLALDENRSHPGKTEVAEALRENSIDAAYNELCKKRKKVDTQSDISSGKKLKGSTKSEEARPEVPDADVEGDDTTTTTCAGGNSAFAARASHRRVQSPPARGPLHAVRDMLDAFAAARAEIPAAKKAPDEQTWLLRALVFAGAAYLRAAQKSLGKGGAQIMVGEVAPGVARDKALREAIRQAAKDLRTKKALLACVKDNDRVKDRTGLKSILGGKKGKLSAKGRKAILDELVNRTTTRTKKR